MSNDLEINFIHNQINANNQVRSVLQQDIANLLHLVHQKRQFLEQLNEADRQLNLRLQAIDTENKTIVTHSNISNW